MLFVERCEGGGLHWKVGVGGVVKLTELTRETDGRSDDGSKWRCGRSASDGCQRLSCFLCIIYCYFRIPEPAGRSFAEIDILFERGVSARKFATTKVDPFEVELHEKAEAQHVERINEKGATTATVMSAESA